MYISLSQLNIDSYITSLQDVLVFGNTIILLHSYVEYDTQEFYPIWRQFRDMIEKQQGFNIVEIDHEAMEYLQLYHKNLYMALGDYNILAGDYRVIYPTVLLFKNGMKTRYQGKLNLDDITRFINAKVYGKVSPKTPTRTQTPRTRTRTQTQTNASTIKRQPSASTPFSTFNQKSISASDKITSLHKDVEKAFARLLK